MATVFLSHSSVDKPFVRALAADLRANNVNVWFDEDVLQPGDSLTDGIAQGLATADQVILVVSQAFLTSAWVQVEAKAALSASIRANGGKVLTILIEDVWEKVSPLLRDLLYVDFRNRQNVLAYREGLGRLCAKLQGGMASAVVATRRRLAVLVTGGRETWNGGRDFDISFELGRALGSVGMAMRTGVARGVDAMFARGANEALVGRGERVRDFLTCYTGKGYTRDHQYGRIIESRFSSRSQGVPELVTDSDVAVLIGGSKNTMYLGVLMLLEGKPILPVASSGGAAADLYNLVMSRLEKTFGIHFDRERLADLADVNLAPTEVATACAQLLMFLQGRSSIGGA